MELITAKFENGLLTMFANGRIDTSNAAEAESLITGFCEQYPTDEVILDAENLEYISSAGLRVVLRTKKAKPQFKIVNVSTEVYEIFEMTGFSEMMTIEKAYRKMSVEGCKIIGKGAKGTVYRYNDDTIIKAYHDSDCLPDIQRERDLARKAFVLGIPTAISYDIVKVDGNFGSVFELLDAKSYSTLIKEDPDNIKKYVKDYAELLKRIHDTTVKPEDMPDAKTTPRRWLETTSRYLSEEDGKKLSELIEAVPDVMNMIHGDYHTNNIMNQNGETLLIDMDTLCHGHPVFELANVFVTYSGFNEVDKQNVEQFLGFSSDLAERVWEIFMPAYFGTDDTDALNDYADKIKLLGYTRIVRHFGRRDPDSARSKEIIAHCSAKIHELLKTVDTLAF